MACRGRRRRGASCPGDRRHLRGTKHRIDVPNAVLYIIAFLFTPKDVGCIESSILNSDVPTPFGLSSFPDGAPQIFTGGVVLAQYTETYICVCSSCNGCVIHQKHVFRRKEVRTSSVVYRCYVGSTVGTEGS